jgi:cytochrome c oxidase subunit 2
MPADLRPRRLLAATLTVALPLLIAGCVDNPNSVFHSRTEFNRDVSSLFSLLIWLGTIVFVFTEALLIWTLWRYRHRKGTPHTPEQVHGNTKLEIMWTVIPAVVLAVIAVPTVQTIFKTQGDAGPEALQVEAIGHQWWWEFRYPQYNVTTANEVYLPIGRKVNFALKTVDVIHSFWIPGLAGKRDNVNNRTNYLWFTPDSTTEAAFNGFCAEYCGTSHANMRFKAFTVTPEQFDAWIAHQQTPAAMGAVAAAPAGTGAQTPPVTPRPTAVPGQQSNPQQDVGRGLPAGVGGPQVPSSAATRPSRTGSQDLSGATGATGTVGAVQAGYSGFPRERLERHIVPQTPIPASIRFDESLRGDPVKGQQLVTRGSCIACHTISGVPGMVSKVGPDLTHVASRLTIGAGLYPNDTRHLGSWVKNARAMKPGSYMQTLGKGQYDPILKTTLTIGLSDQDVADIVAYLQALK